MSAAVFLRGEDSFLALVMYSNSKNAIKTHDESSTTELSFSKDWSTP